MNNTLLVLPSCLKNNNDKIALLQELGISLDQAKACFWQDKNNVSELKKLLIANSFENIMICFFDLIESDIPEFQVVKSLAFNSKMVLIYPDLKLLLHQGLNNTDIESEIIKWKKLGCSALLNIFAQSDLIVVFDENEYDVIARTGRQICAVTTRDYRAGKRGSLDGKRVSKKTSIIMLTYNQVEDTKNCVESLIKYTMPEYELIFIDNGSTDETHVYLEQLKGSRDNIRLIFNDSNLGFAKANNQGIRIAEGDYILLLNNDVILTEGWLERLICCAENDPMIGVVGPSTNKAVGQQVVALTVEYEQRDIARAASLLLMKNAGYWSEAHRIIGFCMLIKKEVIEKTGMLDERFGPGGFEDYDFCLRVNQTGYKIVIANDVFVYHMGGRGYTGNNLDYDKLRQKNVQIFINKWCRKALEVLETL